MIKTIEGKYQSRFSSAWGTDAKESLIKSPASERTAFRPSAKAIVLAALAAEGPT
jgi:hypothetical protein